MDYRIETVHRLLVEYVRSPSLKHIRDGYRHRRDATTAVNKVAYSPDLLRR